MSAVAQTVRPKHAPPAAEVRRSAQGHGIQGQGVQGQGMVTGAPRYLRASMKLGGLHDPEEHEAEHAAHVIGGGGTYKVKDPGGAGHLRAADDGGGVRRAGVVDPGAAGQVRRTAEAGSLRAAISPPVVDPGASGQVRRTADTGALRATATPVPETAGPVRRIAGSRVEDRGGAGFLRALPGDGPLRSAATGALPASDEKAAANIERARAAAAKPLPGSVQARLEHGFGESMDGVQVHTGPAARRAASSIGARAYTEGERITLGHGESEHDLHLMAHEATHVVQNRRAAGIPRRLPATTRRTAAPEQTTARRAVDGNAARATPAEQSTARRAADGQTTRATATADPQPVRRVAADQQAAAQGPIRRLGLKTILDGLADLANMIPGFRLFTIILGINPINMQSVDRSGANILRAAVEMIPGGGLIVKALEQYGIFEKAGAFVDEQVSALGMAGSAIRDALMDLLESLGWRDILHPGDVWDRAKAIFTGPIDRIIALFEAMADALIELVKDAILKPLGALLSKTRAWDLLTAIIGKDPITGEAVPQTADTLIGGFMKLIGQDDVWQNIKKANAVDRAFAWFQGAMETLVSFATALPGMFMDLLKSFSIEDLLDLPGAVGRVLGVFGDFAGRFFSWALDAAFKLLEIVFDVVSPGAWGYVKKTGAALKSILKNPLPFVRNLVAAAKMGLGNFAANIGNHLKAGLISWLTGALSGVYLPTALTLAEMGKFALSVLGITWAQIRGKIVKALGPAGERIMQGLETTFDVVVALVKGGPAAAWNLIKEKLTNLKDMVIDGIKGFVIDTIVKKAIPKLVAMFIPGAGFISAIISIYDTVMVFVQKLAQIAATVKAFVDSIVAIAAGQIGAAAARVERSLAGLLSLAISFLAGFLGLGNISSKVMGVVKKVQTFVDKALDAAIGWIVGKAKALFGKLFGKDEKKKDGGPADEKTRKAVQTVQKRVNDMLAKGVPRTELKSKVQGWAGELGVKKVGVEEGKGSDTVYVENSPRFTTNTVINANVEGVYKMIYDIAKERLGAATTPIATATGVTEPQRIVVAPGTDPLTIAKGLQAQGPASGVGVGFGRGVPVGFAGGEAIAARKGGVGNFVVTKLGKYPEIAALLQAKGMSVGDIANAMTRAIATGQGDPDILRLVALMHGAEPAREALPAATTPLLLGSALTPDSSLRGASPQELFGTDKKGGLDPVSPVGARPTMQRAEATIVQGKSFPEGTGIAARTEAHIKNVAQGVFQAVLHMDFRDTVGLRSRVLELIDIYDKASGVRK